MYIAMTVMEITAPVFFLALIGFLWVRMGYEYKVEFVTRLAMKLAIPCLVFTALMNAKIEPEALAQLFTASVLAHIAIALITAAFIYVLKFKIRTLLAPMVFGNTGNLGLPLVLFAFGQDGLGLGIIVFGVSTILIFTFGTYILTGGGQLGRILKEPVVWACILGALFLLQGWHTPKVITNTIELIGQIGIPIMLITLGVAVARLKVHNFKTIFGLCLLRYALNISITFSVAVLMGLPQMAASVLIVQMATPVAVSSYLMAEKYRTDPEAVAGLVVISTTMSVVLLPVLLAILL